VAGRLQAAAGPTQTVARIDGDQFVVLCSSTDAAAARAVATAVLESISVPIVIGDRTLFVTATIGVANGGDTDPLRLLPSAHSAMFRGKTRGRGRVEVHETAHCAETSDELQLITDLHWALRREELELFYQPVIDLESGTSQQVEALLRWRHPTRGDVGPAEFIPLAESSGLIDDLGEWVLRRACAEAASWTYGPGGPLDVAVNVSPLQLRNAKLVQTITDALRCSQLKPERLILEITESAVLDSGVTGPLEQLRSLGLRVALDDFGTGFASLAHVKALPLDQLKIDQSFVRDLTTGAADTAIVSSLAALAAGVRLELVAEGVETQQQADALRRLGCTRAQGFLWSPAVPAAELQATIARLRPQSLRHRRLQAEQVLDPAIVSRMLTMSRRGASAQTIAAALNAEGLVTSRGTRWHRASVVAQLERLGPAGRS
jgi:predicted signal transduction protein with EAL and GGDEF domain